MKVTYEVEIEPEDVPVRGNAMASGDKALDKECEDAIFKDLENGNEYAWCYARVIAESGGYKGEASLGCISCKDHKEFEEVFLPSMKDEALMNLGIDMAAHDGTEETPAFAGSAPEEI